MDKNPRAAKASSRPHQDTHAAARAPTLDRAARSTSVVATIVCALLPFAPAFSHADTPMAYTVGFGARNYPVVNLLWALLIVSLLVILIVTGLLVGGLIRRRDVPLSNDPRLVPLERPERGLGWIYIGTAISAAVLVGATIWTCSTLAAVSGPPRDAKVKIHVIGHQWWWEVRYDSDEPSRVFTTANEIHIPTGEPVRIELSSVDVIHSFWVPELSGKTDLIPGQQNDTWIEADRPGTYRGQCGEYCGLQHAHMALAVIAEPPAQFRSWWDGQLQAPPAPQSQTVAAGEANFITKCGICHSVRGTMAGGRLGPDLSHLMNRQTIAAGTLPNTPGYLSGWIADPQHIKPGNLMPILDLSGTQLADIRQFLESLK
jgi:cytochrome c oxidase subunit II